MCIVFPSLSVYIDIWGSLYRVWLFVRVRMWAFWDPLLFVFTLSYLFESKMSDLLLGALGHCYFHHYIHCWCDLLHVWFESIITFLRIFIVSLSSLSLPVIHLIRFPPCYFLTLTYSRFDISLASFLCISLLVWFASLSHYWYYIHIGHPQVHGSRAFLYMLHFIHEGMSFLSLGIWAYFPFISITLSP